MRKKLQTELAPIELKTSFTPIASPETSILILGSSPGDRSLALQEYYGHPQNRFWRIISAISNSPIPVTYDDKKNLLLRNNIGVWDVAHKVIRKGSMDSAITYDEPNDIDGFISQHKRISIIGFNGQKAEALFNKYVKRNPAIIYIPLPSSSPANAGINFTAICERWAQLLQ